MIPVLLGPFNETVKQIVSGFEFLRLELCCSAWIEMFVEEPAVCPPSAAVRNERECPVHTGSEWI